MLRTSEWLRKCECRWSKMRRGDSLRGAARISGRQEPNRTPHGRSCACHTCTQHRVALQHRARVSAVAWCTSEACVQADCEPACSTPNALSPSCRSTTSLRQQRQRRQEERPRHRMITCAAAQAQSQTCSVAGEREWGSADMPSTLLLLLLRDSHASVVFPIPPHAPHSARCQHAFDTRTLGQTCAMRQRANTHTCTSGLTPLACARPARMEPAAMLRLQPCSAVGSCDTDCAVLRNRSRSRCWLSGRSEEQRNDVARNS